MRIDRHALRTLRVSSLLSQRELARRAGISPGYVHDLESGRRRPSLRLVRRLATALAVSPEELATPQERSTT